MGVFQRSWEITKLSFSTIGKDKEMLWYPFLSGIFSLIFSIAMLFPKIILVIYETYQANNSATYNDLGFQMTEYLFVFLTYLGLAFIATFFNVCVVYTTKTRFEGGNATFGSSLKFAFSKIHLIFLWSLLSATVGLLLYMLDMAAQNMGKWGRVLVSILRALIATAWNLTTIFVVPAMVYDNLRPFPAIKKSSQTFIKTWGENLIRHLGLGLIKFLYALLGIIIAVVAGYFLFTAFGIMGILIAVGIFLLYFLILSLIFNVATSIFNTSLYVFADTGKVPKGYNKTMLENAFQPKKIKS